MADPLPAPIHSSLLRLADAPIAFDYDDISLVPRHASTLPHRSDARPDVRLGPAHLEVPIVGSPMPDVCGPEMCQALAEEGALGILHRFQSIDEEAEHFRAAAGGGTAAVGAAVGVTGDYRERFDALVEAGCRILPRHRQRGARSGGDGAQLGAGAPR